MDAVVGRICDLSDRIVVVNTHQEGDPVIGDRESETALAGTLTVIDRRDGKRRTAAIDATSKLVDRCGGAGGGRAGCSAAGGDEIESPLLEGHTLRLGNFRDYGLDSGRYCRDANESPWSAMCATSSRLAAVEMPNSGLIVNVYDGSGVASSIPNGVSESPAFSEPIQASDRGYVGKRVKLELAGKRGTLDVDGVREPCLALWEPTTR